MTSIESSDPLAILGALGVVAIGEVTPVSAGWGATELWRFQRQPENGRAPERCVLRLRQAGRHAENAMWREVSAYRTVASVVPVPNVLAEGIVEGRPAMVLDWIAGRPGHEVLFQHPDRAEHVGRQCGSTLAAIHALDAPAELRGERAFDWIGWAGDLGERLRPRLEAAMTRWSAPRLLHLDVHPMNILIDPATFQLSAILDWENAAAGDPRADLARTWSILTFVPRLNLIPVGSEPLVDAFWQGLVAGWETRHGPVGDLAIFKLWARAAQFADLEPKMGRPGVTLTREQLEWLRADRDHQANTVV